MNGPANVITFVIKRVGKDWVTDVHVDDGLLPPVIAAGEKALTAPRGPSWEIALANARVALRRSGKVK